MNDVVPVLATVPTPVRPHAGGWTRWARTAQTVRTRGEIPVENPTPPGSHGTLALELLDPAALPRPVAAIDHLGGLVR